MIYSHELMTVSVYYLHVVGVLVGSDCTSLDEELVNSDETANVTTWHVLDGLHITPHH